MNKLTTVITATVLTLTTATMANATDLVATDNSVTTNLCMTAAKGSTHAMRHAIKDSRLSKDFIIDNVKCNNQSFLSFVDQHGQQSEKITYLLTRNRVVETSSQTDIAKR